MITKKRKGEITDTFKVVDDIRYGFDCLISQTQKKDTKSNIIKFDINYTNSKHKEDLNFKLTNKVFNSLHKQYYYEKLNYLFVIENNEILSRGNYLIDDLDEVRVHTHIVIDTTIPLLILQKKLVNVLGKQSDIYSEDITKRNDKYFYINYLVKQNRENKYLNYNSYNFKVDF
jgi:hypothetical protein